VISSFAPSAVISLDNVLYNLKGIRKRISSSFEIIAVVKDNAYGCGASAVANILEQEGNVRFFAVASAQEAFSLRSSGLHSPILILGKCDDKDLRKGADQSMVFTCNSPEDLFQWKECACPVRFHCNINTGMNRLGIATEDIGRFVSRLSASPDLDFQGVFTHMASADTPDTSTVGQQLQRFRSALSELDRNGLQPEMIHYANSATLMRFPPSFGTHIRPGIALYGCVPDPEQTFDLSLKPVLTLKGTVVSLKETAAGTPVSYGGNYITRKNTVIATVNAGYAHGVPRYLSSRGHILIGGKRHPIAGNVTMDYIMADIGADHSVNMGDEAVVIGSQGDAMISPDEIASIGNTIGYEVLCNIGTSIERTYTFRNKPVARQAGFHF
jgi:alanine racemase